MEKVQEPVTLEFHIDYELQKSTVTIKFDPITGKSEIHTTYDPDPTKMHTKELIQLMEEAAFHRMCLQEKEPKATAGDQHLHWQERCMQVEELFGQAHDELENHLYKRWNPYKWKKASIMQSSLEEWPALWLKGPEDYLACWYTYGHFPERSEMTELVDLELALRQKLYAPEEKDTRAYRLWEFRRDLKAEQLKDARRMLMEIQARCTYRLPGKNTDQNWLVLPIQYEMQKCTAVIHIDPEDGERYEFFYYDPDPMNMDEPALIGFVEELMFRLVCLKNEELVDGGADRQVIWQERCTQVEELLEECKARLRTFGGFFANWYANGCFPEEKSFWKLWYYKNDLLERAYSERSAILSLDSEQLRDFRCGLIAKQQEELQMQFDTLSAGMKIYKTCRVKCLRCEDVLEYVNQAKDDRLVYQLICSCGKVGLGPAAIGYRIIGNPSDYEDLSEEWELESGEIQSCMQN